MIPIVLRYTFCRISRIDNWHVEHWPRAHGMKKASAINKKCVIARMIFQIENK
jgi:hypothetical protein